MKRSESEPKQHKVSYEGMVTAMKVGDGGEGGWKVKGSVIVVVKVGGALGYWGSGYRSCGGCGLGRGGGT